MQSKTMKYLKLLALATLMTCLLASCDSRTASTPAAANDAMCAAKATQGALDEACAIEIAKGEIARQLKGVHYSKYTARFDTKDRQWVVMAYDENGPPDSHTFLLISPTGKVEQIHQGT
jgi:hypothetical protein